MANVGGAMGGGARLVAIDVDGPDGRRSFDEIERAARARGEAAIPPTLTTQSGRDDGGEHRVFRLPADLDAAALRNRAGAVAPGLDVRADGGQIVLPPSLHATGRRYSMSLHVDPAPLPAWLFGVLAAPARRPHDSNTARSTIGNVRLGCAHAAGTPYGDAALRLGADRVAAAPEGTRNDTLCREAFGIAQLCAGGVIDADAAWEVLRGAATAAGLSEHEAESTIASAFVAGAKHPRGVPTRVERSGRSSP